MIRDFRVHCVVSLLTLILTLIFKNDILYFLNYVRDIHASINLANTHYFAIYDEGERSIDLFMATILE